MMTHSFAVVSPRMRPRSARRVTTVSGAFDSASEPAALADVVGVALDERDTSRAFPSVREHAARAIAATSDWASLDMARKAVSRGGGKCRSLDGARDDKPP